MGNNTKAEKRIKLFAVNLVTVCVNGGQGGDYRGVYWDQYHTEAHPFISSMDLIWKLDSHFDELNFPQRSTVPRSFYPVKAEAVNHIKRLERVRVMSDIDEKRGEQATFIVQVKYRQNSTWQGQVVWAEENKKVYFRSALELLKLMDGALSRGGFEDDGREEQQEE